MPSITWATKIMMKWVGVSTKWIDQIDQPTDLFVEVCTFVVSFFFSIRYHGSSSSIKCHVYHHVGGEDTHPWCATKVGDPITATIPVTKKTTNRLLKPATMHSTGRIFLKTAMI